MLWGILIGIALTLIGTLLGVAVSGGKSLVPLSYIVIVLSLLAFCVEGVALLGAIESRRDTDNTVTAIQEAALTYLPSSAQDYRMGAAEASGVKIGLRFLYPQVARYIEPSDLVGHTVAESTEVLRAAILRDATHRIWMTVIWMVVTMVLTVVLLLAAASMGGGGSRRGHRAARTAVHGRAPRNSHRGGRRR